MDIFLTAAKTLGMLPGELVAHIVAGMFPEADGLTKEEFSRHVIRRYDEYHVIPQWLSEYCEAVLKRPDFTQKSGLVEV